METTRRSFLFKVMPATVAALSTFGLSGAFAAETPDESTESGAVSVVDSRGVTVELDKPAEKIVCLLNSGLNDLEMLGAADRVVGIDEWTYTNEITYQYLAQIDERIANKEIPAVDGNMEAILGLEPDLVIIWKDDTEKIDVLEQNGIPVCGIQVNNFDEVYTKLHMIATLVGKDERADEIEAYAKGVLEEIAEKTAGVEDKKTGIFVWGATMLDLAGATSTGHSMLEYCGVQDCAAGVEEEHFVAKIEDVLGWDPQAILMWNCADIDPQNYLEDSQWADVAAVKDGLVFEIADDETYFCDMWTVKYIYGIEYFALSVYPELFEDADMDSFRDSMMQELYGTTVAMPEADA